MLVYRSRSVPLDKAVSVDECIALLWSVLHRLPYGPPPPTPMAGVSAPLLHPAIVTAPSSYPPVVVRRTGFCQGKLQQSPCLELTQRISLSARVPQAAEDFLSLTSSRNVDGAEAVEHSTTEDNGSSVALPSLMPMATSWNALSREAGSYLLPRSELTGQGRSPGLELLLHDAREVFERSVASGST